MRNLITLHKRAAFSLVEVVVAVGIFALAIVGVIGLLSPTNKAIADVADSDNATRVVNAVQQGLQQLASSGRFTTVGSVVGVGSSAINQSTSDGLIWTTAPTDPADGTALPTSTTKLTLYASRDGSKIGLLGDTAVWGSAAATDHTQKYFEIILIRNTALSKNDAASTADTASGYLAYTMRIRWPAYTPDGNEFKIHTQKSVLIVPGAITR